MAHKRGSETTWDRVDLAPIVLIKSKEEVLADRAWERLLSQARAQDPEIDVSTIDAGAYTAGEIALLASPSLFGGAKIVRASGVENATDDFLRDLLELIANPSPDLYLIAIRNGGNKGPKLFTSAAQAGFPVVTIDELKWDSDKIGLLKGDARRAQRAVTDDAYQALVQSMGSNVREMSAALNQLFSDVDGTITGPIVKKYFGGRVESSGFDIADAAVAGNAGRALQLLRQALATGTPEVLVVAALAWKFRQLATVSASMGKNGQSVTVQGSPNQIKNARMELRTWSDAGLAAAITAIAKADSDVKGFRGEAKDPAYAVERCIRDITLARRL
ncbi:DNA polymerase III subunit delta [Flaviflexus equikiangi]|uniref:DNA-directed DNA polymerase n=1 Tax=Flaviflexus equikiangi TaxID=2758573 RepID=A0ABS2TDQ1_9ACTO|nr:DNA polymerase III subunit delta [Flaviflexus equikiangi]MBM9432780.1 DNA polymerase III subunit delta [Flaviflexus equikiangi]